MSFSVFLIGVPDSGIAASAGEVVAFRGGGFGFDDCVVNGVGCVDRRQVIEEAFRNKDSRTC